MDLEAIEKRIEQLEAYKDQLDEKIAEIEREKEQIQGAITEMWRWHEKNLEVHEYGGIRYDGKKKIHKLPTFGSAEAVEEGINTRFDAQVAGDFEIAFEARKDKAKQDAQKAVDEISKMNKGERD